MRLAISNIAWPAGADADAALQLRERGVEGVELALTKIWPEPLDVPESEVRAYRAWWEKRGFHVAALQALLFGKPNLTLFDGEPARQQMRDYLIGMIERAGQLGTSALVFGSPKNRQKRGLSEEVAHTVAVPFFRELGAVARRWGVRFCIEPNPPEYGCDFVTTVAQGIALVDVVADEGFALHLDTAAMSLAGDPCAESIAAAGTRCHHFHVSAPYLEEVGAGVVPHAQCASALRLHDYRGWVSIEMGEPKQAGTWREHVERSVSFVRSIYHPHPRETQAREPLLAFRAGGPLLNQSRHADGAAGPAPSC
jgi:sugar phosphate isomerase/epimerase